MSARRGEVVGIHKVPAAVSERRRPRDELADERRVIKRTKERLPHGVYLKLVTQTEGMPACATQSSPTVRAETPLTLTQ